MNFIIIIIIGLKITFADSFTNNVNNNTISNQDFERQIDYLRNRNNVSVADYLSVKLNQNSVSFEINNTRYNENTPHILSTSLHEILVNVSNTKENSFAYYLEAYSILYKSYYIYSNGNSINEYFINNQSSLNSEHIKKLIDNQTFSLRVFSSIFLSHFNILDKENALKYQEISSYFIENKKISNTREVFNPSFNVLFWSVNELIKLETLSLKESELAIKPYFDIVSLLFEKYPNSSNTIFAYLRDVFELKNNKTNVINAYALFFLENVIKIAEKGNLSFSDARFNLFKTIFIYEGTEGKTNFELLERIKDKFSKYLFNNSENIVSERIKILLATNDKTIYEYLLKIQDKTFSVESSLNTSEIIKKSFLNYIEYSFITENQTFSHFSFERNIKAILNSLNLIKDNTFYNECLFLIINKFNNLNKELSNIRISDKGKQAFITLLEEKINTLDKAKLNTTQTELLNTFKEKIKLINTPKNQGNYNEININNKLKEISEIASSKPEEKVKELSKLLFNLKKGEYFLSSSHTASIFAIYLTNYDFVKPQERIIFKSFFNINEQEYQTLTRDKKMPERFTKGFNIESPKAKARR